MDGIQLPPGIGGIDHRANKSNCNKTNNHCVWTLCLAQLPTVTSLLVDQVHLKSLNLASSQVIPSFTELFVTEHHFCVQSMSCKQHVSAARVDACFCQGQQ